MFFIVLFVIGFGLIWVCNVMEINFYVCFDVLLVVFLVFGFGGFIYGFSSIGEVVLGYVLIFVWILIVVGVVFLMVFVFC